MNGDKEESLAEFSASGSKSLRKSAQHLDVGELKPPTAKPQSKSAGLINNSYESNSGMKSMMLKSQATLNPMAATALKRMQTMKSKLLGGKSDKKGRRDKERDITDEDVIKVLKKEMVKSKLFYNIGKSI